ncbi:MAG: DUF2085 domain-containing protein [Anaerolineae bacterium]|jgi:uncharacterized membrane protein
MTDHPSEPTAQEIVSEAQRRVARRQASSSKREGSSTLSPAKRRLVIGADRFIFWLAQHWLAIFNVMALLYVGLPFLAPILMRVGVEPVGRAIYALYRPLCHQLPYRSWYLFGSQLHYGQEELARLVGAEALVPHGYIGDPTLGFKVALCQRDTAIYGTIFLAGVLFALIRRRVRPLPLWVYVLFILPMALDGGLQLFSYALPILIPSLDIPTLESNPVRRVITGSLFGLGTVWLAYPYVEESFREILETLEQRFGWES